MTGRKTVSRRAPMSNTIPKISPFPNPLMYPAEENQSTPLRKRRHAARHTLHNPLPRQAKRPHDTRDKPHDKPLPPPRASREPASALPKAIVGGGARRLRNKKRPFPVLPRPGPGRIPPEAASPPTRLRLQAFPAPPQALVGLSLPSRRMRHSPASSARHGRGGKPGHPRRKRRLSASGDSDALAGFGER